MKLDKIYLLPIGFAIPLALMIALVFVGLQSMAEIQDRLKQITEHNNVKTSLVTQMRYAARERTMRLYRMVTLDDPFEKDDEFMRFNSFGAMFANARIALIEMGLSADEDAALKRQAKFTKAAVASQNAIIDLAIGDESEEAIEILYEITVPAQESVFLELTELLNIQQQATRVAAEASIKEYQSAKRLMLLFCAIAAMLGFVVAILVIRHSHLTEKNLFLEKEKAQVTLHSIGDGVITTDSDGVVEYLNPVAEKMTGWCEDEAIGTHVESVFYMLDSDLKKVQKNPIELSMSQSRIVNSSDNFISNKIKDKTYAVEYTAGPMHDNENNIIGAVLVFRNVTDIRDMALQMRYQATHDSLTGLINRSEFEKRLDLALNSARKTKTRHVLCYFDLDQFKVVNDTCGHVAGDELLKQIVSLLSNYLRRVDTLARLGGDEFGILLSNCDIVNAEKVADKLRIIIKDFRFSWDDKSFAVGASFGLVAINPDCGTITDILSAADSACYVAKDLGRNRLHVYKQDDKDLAERQGEMQWLPRIREALEQDMFCLYCQQILPLGRDDADSVRYEILIRLVGNDGKIIPPMAFIPAAERYHLMPSLDRWVISGVFRFLSEFKNPNVQQSWAINLSGQSISDEEILDFIITEMEKYHIDPKIICFEVTETAAVKNLSRATEFIAALKELGCRFSLDDFGSGLSSFTYLKNLPVDYLKIDGSFVKDMITDPIDLAMVKSINQIGHTMGIRTIAEFVENDEILNELKLMRVDYAQGYGVHVPQALSDLNT